MILPIAVDALGILLMRGFFLQVPASIEEAARIDGAGIFRTYWEADQFSHPDSVPFSPPSPDTFADHLCETASLQVAISLVGWSR